MQEKAKSTGRRVLQVAQGHVAEHVELAKALNAPEIEEVAWLYGSESNLFVESVPPEPAVSPRDIWRQLSADTAKIHFLGRLLGLED